MSFSINGLDEFTKKLQARPGKVKQATKGALFQEAEMIMSKAKPLTPVDRGFLRASGHVQLPVEDGEKISVTLGFGGVAGSGNQGETNPEDVGYAVIVHEDLEKNHPVGQAKFLEMPFNEAKIGMADRIASNIKSRLK